VRTAMLSIRPEYVDEIRTGRKRHEFRRRAFKQPVGWVVVYETSPVAAVTCAFSIVGSTALRPSELWRRFRGEAGIDRSAFFEYFRQCDRGVAYHLGDVVTFANPVPRAHMPFAPPQSYRYVDDDFVERMISAQLATKRAS
jgi:predicted transcriptional regulator